MFNTTCFFRTSHQFERYWYCNTSRANEMINARVTGSNIADTYLDVHISTNKTRCIKHELTTRTSNIQEWCEYCSEVSHFNQIVTSFLFPVEKQKQIEKNCKLCGKVIYQPNVYVKFKLCSDCYRISSGWTESAFARKSPILYLPWWDTRDQCIVCNQSDYNLYRMQVLPDDKHYFWNYG